MKNKESVFVYAMSTKSSVMTECYSLNRGNEEPLKNKSSQLKPSLSSFVSFLFSLSLSFCRSLLSCFISSKMKGSSASLVSSCLPNENHHQQWATMKNARKLINVCVYRLGTTEHPKQFLLIIHCAGARDNFDHFPFQVWATWIQSFVSSLCHVLFRCFVFSLSLLFVCVQKAFANATYTFLIYIHIILIKMSLIYVTLVA